MRIRGKPNTCNTYYARAVEPPTKFHSEMVTAFSMPILFKIIIVLIAASLALGICNAASASSELRVGSELEFPPYAFVDESGLPAGFSVDLIKAVANVMGLQIKISTDPWDTVWKALVAGRLDVLPIVAKLPERQLLVDFSIPHTETYDAFFVRKGTPSIQNIEGAKGKEIVVMRSDAAHHALLERNFQGRLILVNTIPQGLLLISSGKHDAFLCSKLIGTMSITKHGLKGLTAGPPIPEYKRVFSFAVKKGDSELLEKLNQGLLIIKTSGEYDRIYERWLTADDPWRKLKKYLLPTIAIVIAITLIVGFWLAMLQLLVKKRSRELAEANEALRQLSIKLLSAHEEERKRIAGELHDTIGSGLTAIKFKVEDLRQQIGNDTNVPINALNTIIPIIQESIDECRRIQMDLRPSMLDDLGLLPTLSWFCKRFQTIYSGIRIEQEIEIEEGDVPPPRRIVIFRVIQETMNNIAKHSRANLVRLCLRKLNDRMELILQDNGQGFDLEKTRFDKTTERGLGLSSMKERTELSGGSFDIESSEGKGTIIRASWPI